VRGLRRSLSVGFAAEEDEADPGAEEHAGERADTDSHENGRGVATAASVTSSATRPAQTPANTGMQMSIAMTMYRTSRSSSSRSPPAWCPTGARVAPGVGIGCTAISASLPRLLLARPPRASSFYVIVVHIVPNTTLWMIAGAKVDSARYLDELRDHFEATTLAPLRRADPFLAFHLDIGDPARELAAVARRCDAELIAVGASGHTALHDVVFGGMERRLAHLTDVPVVAIPRRARSLRLVD
jgi:nucleotide-binding universal stress UspA family protein